MDKTQALNNLIDFTNVLEYNKVRWFLAFGTCLGAYREGKIIGHDKDMDIGIMAEDFDFSILSQMQEIGFEVKFIFGMRFLGYEIAFTRNDIKIDLIFYYKKDDKIWNALWKNGGRNGMSDIIKLVYPKELFDNWDMGYINGHKFIIPNDTISYIKSIYGNNWEVVDKKWKWWESPFNIDNNFKI